MGDIMLVRWIYAAATEWIVETYGSDILGSQWRNYFDFSLNMLNMDYSTKVRDSSVSLKV